MRVVDFGNFRNNNRSTDSMNVNVTCGHFSKGSV
jgi:hypothetical protein